MAGKLKNGPVEEFILGDWLKEGAEGMRGKMEEKRERMEKRFQKRTRIDTSEFRAHMRQARKEQLLAIRSLVDSALECIKGGELDQKPPQ
jgi:hypothetical protein